MKGFNHDQPIPESGRPHETRTVPEMYVPTVNEKRRGKWAAVFQMKDRNGVPDASSVPHIVPTIGNLHLIGEWCWCSPQRVAQKIDDRVIVTIVHNVLQ